MNSKYQNNSSALYTTLLELPLFLGLTTDELTKALEMVEIEFFKYKNEEQIVKENSSCLGLFFMIKGSVVKETRSKSNSYTIGEVFNAPYIIQPECLFGLTQYYNSTFISKGHTQFMYLKKTEILKLFNNFQIFRINLINIYSTAVQRLIQPIYTEMPQNTRQKLIAFIKNRCTKPSGTKIIKVKMTTLAKEFSTSRLSVSKVLNTMQNEGVLVIGREKIVIPALEQILKQNNNYK